MSSSVTVVTTRNPVYGLEDERGGGECSSEGGGVTPTTKRELWSWYLYDWANSVYFTVAIGGFLPLQLLRLTQLQWCSTRIPASAELHALCDEDHLPGFDDAYVRVGALSIRPDSAATYFISLSVLTQAFTFIALGPLADFGALRYKLLVSFGVSGAIATSSLFFVWTPSLWWLAGMGIVVSNTCIGASIIFYNAFLPLLVEGHEDVIAAKRNDAVVTKDDEASTPSTTATTKMTSVEEVRELVTNRISSTGFLLGFVSGVLLICFCAGLALSGVLSAESVAGDTLVYRFSNLVTGIWWLVFGIISYSGIKCRPALARLPKSFRVVATLGFKCSWKTLTTSFHVLPNSFLMLVGWFFYSDGINTLASVGSIFAASELDMTGAELSLILAEVPLFAALGSYLFQKLYERTKWTPKSMIQLILKLFLPLPLYTIAGFLPFLPFGMKHKWEMYVFGAWFGLLLGPVQAFSRSMYMDLIPKNQEARFFSLYEITDKGSSWIGPLLAGLIANLGTMRYAMLVVLMNVLIGYFFLRRVDHTAGRRQAQAAADSGIATHSNGEVRVPGDRDLLIAEADKELEMGTIAL